MWQVTSGPCSIDDNHCLRSPNYPEKYGKGQTCTITIPNPSSAVPIVVKSFETESRWDKLVVNKAVYSGNDGPEGVVPQGSISWSSDSSVEKSGFLLCPKGHESMTTTTTVTSSSADSMWKVKLGQCQVDVEGCVTSPNYPQNYGSRESCLIDVNADKATPIKVESFLTESRFDQLKVNGQYYSGSGQGLSGVLPVGSVTWKSDGSVQKAGWKLCPTP